VPDRPGWAFVRDGPALPAPPGAVPLRPSRKRNVLRTALPIERKFHAMGKPYRQPPAGSWR
jgi:hypothetical protein